MKHVKASVTIEKKSSSADSVCIHLIPEVHYKVMGHSLDRREKRGLPEFAIPGTKFTIPLMKPRTGAVVFREMQKGTNANELHACLFIEKDGVVEVIESPLDEQVCERWNRIQSLGQTAFLDTEKGWFVTTQNGEGATEALELEKYCLVQANSFFRYVFGHTQIGALEASARRVLNYRDKDTPEIGLLNDIIVQQNLELVPLREEAKSLKNRLMHDMSLNSREMGLKDRWIHQAKTVIAQLSKEKGVRKMDDHDRNFVMEIANIRPGPDLIKSCQAKADEAKSRDRHRVEELCGAFRKTLSNLFSKRKSGKTEKSEEQ